MFNLESFLYGDCAVTFSSDEVCDKFLSILDNRGITWYTGESASSGFTRDSDTKLCICDDGYVYYHDSLDALPTIILTMDDIAILDGKYKSKKVIKFAVKLAQEIKELELTEEDMQNILTLIY